MKIKAREVLKKTIVLIDDEVEMADLLSKKLLKLGYNVEKMSNIDGAMNFIKNNVVDLAISDINMPGKSGFELLDWINEHSPCLPLILITGFLDENDAKLAVDKGCFGFLAKPVSGKELKRVVKNALTLQNDHISDLDFARIPIEDFITGKVVNFPVYVRLGDRRFLKVAHTGNQISLERVEKFKENDVKELWIDKEDLDSYLELCQKIYNVNKVHRKLLPDQKINLIRHSGEVVYEKMRLCYIDSDLIQHGLGLMCQLINEVANYEDLGVMIESFFKQNKSEYGKALLEAVLCALVAKTMDWSSSENIKNLMLGALLKDIGLKELPFEIRSLAVDHMSGEEYDVYKEHPKMSLEALENVKDLNSNVLTIIAQHHEDGTQNAFPKKIPTFQIYPPAILVRLVDKFYEKAFQGHAKVQHRNKVALLDILETLPKNSVESSFCRALSSVIKAKNLEHASELFGQ